MRAIDFRTKGNAVRIYLTQKEDLTEIWGDDWDDKGSTDPVYPKFVDGYIDLTFDFKHTVLNCNELIDAYKGCKADMVKGKFPMIIILPTSEDWHEPQFIEMMGMKNAQKIYFGDEFTPEVINPYTSDDFYKVSSWMSL